MMAEIALTRARRGFRPGTALIVAISFAILISLGVWQVQRLYWKHAILAQIAALQSAPAAPLGAVLHRLEHRRIDDLVPGEVDYVRVQLDCPRLEQTPTLRVYALLGGVMGRRLVTACPISAGPYRSILVDRGFSPEGAMSTHPSSQNLTQPVIGVLRRAERRSFMALPDNPAANDWRNRDIPAMAAALHAQGPAPVFLMLESPRPQDGGPLPAALPTDIPDNHLGYALTWFGLALGLMGVYVASLLRAPKAVADAPSSRV